jgi:hypothetical protein
MVTKAELIEALKPFDNDTKILVGGVPARVWYVLADGNVPAYISVDEYEWEPEDNTFIELGVA